MIRLCNRIGKFLSTKAVKSTASKIITNQKSNYLTYAFDLDGTLCTLTDGKYEDAKPFPDRIMHVNDLKAAGNRIIIFTARGATSGRDLKELTTNQLTRWGLNFDSLLFGKPHFDLLVDDKAISEFTYFDVRHRLPSTNHSGLNQKE